MAGKIYWGRTLLLIPLKFAEDGVYSLSFKSLLMLPAKQWREDFLRPIMLLKHLSPSFQSLSLSSTLSAPFPVHL